MAYFSINEQQKLQNIHDWLYRYNGGKLLLPFASGWRKKSHRHTPVGRYITIRLRQKEELAVSS